MVAGLQSESPSERIAACVRAAETRQEGALPLLVDRLEDVSGDVRFSAIMALKKMTGRTLGYRWYGGDEERAGAVRRWREWVKSFRLAEKGD